MLRPKAWQDFDGSTCRATFRSATSGVCCPVLIAHRVSTSSGVVGFIDAGACNVLWHLGYTHKRAWCPPPAKTQTQSLNARRP
jgi:hypothetical protein